MFVFCVVLCNCLPTCRDAAKRHDTCRSFLRRHLAVTHDMSSRHLRHVIACLFKTQNFASKRHVILRHSQLSFQACCHDDVDMQNMRKGRKVQQPMLCQVSWQQWERLIFENFEHEKRKFSMLIWGSHMLHIESAPAMH